MNDVSGLRSMAKHARNAAYRLAREEMRARPLRDHAVPDITAGDHGNLPTYSVYRPRPENATGTIVVVLPGGGYSAHAEHEAAPVGRWVRSIGAVGVVLRYRVAPHHRYPAMLDDVLEAVSMCRRNADAWNANAARVGILGFSAGGHLAALAATSSATASETRPDFAILIYPVIRMVGKLAHPGCRAALLGNEAETELAATLDADARVQAGSPPAFLVHGWNDEVVDVRNSIVFADACRNTGTPCELHVFAYGPHGFGLGRRAGAAAEWPSLCKAWLAGLG